MAGLPLNRAAHRRHKSRRRLFAREDRIEDLAQHLLLHALRVFRVVELPSVPELARGVEHKEIGRAHGPVRLRDLLALIPEVREVVPLAFRAFDHVREVVLRITLFIVRVDHHELDTFPCVIPLNGNRAIFPRLHVRAVIAPERDGEDGLVLERRERIRLPIDGREREVRSRRSNWESLVFHELHDITGLTHPCGRYRLSPQATFMTEPGAHWEHLVRHFCDANFIIHPPDGAIP